MGFQKCTHQLHTTSSQLIQNPGLHPVYSSPRIMLSGPICQMSLHDRLLISKFFNFFLMGLILKLADRMGGRHDHIISQYRTFYFTITIYLIYHMHKIKVANYKQ